ncbi:hypothetical protein DSUL_90071 [Desulfovibrionales bacterium]
MCEGRSYWATPLGTALYINTVASPPFGMYGLTMSRNRSGYP